MIGDQLSLPRKLAFGVGHVLNDLSASMWFSYLLIYLHRIVMFDNALAGYMMLLGQVADAFSTAFVGFESDRTQSGFCNYGRRKSWHLIGVISVLVSFPFMFNLCPTCENSPEWARFMYYAPFVVIFQFGWAATQISHLSLLPQLTSLENERVALNAIRYAFTVSANLFVYALTYLLLKFHNSDESDDDLNRNDAPKFMYLTVVVCAVGFIFQMVFHIGTREKQDKSETDLQEAQSSYLNQRTKSWKDYLKSHSFWILALLYMNTRLVVNMSQVYLTMYVADTVQLDKPSIALIPLICYVSGLIATLPLRYLSKYLGPYVTYVIGVALILVASSLFWFYDLIFDPKINSIVAAVFLGSGSTVILVTSLSLTTDMIGRNTQSGAFVFGSMSFTDKLSNGIVVALLQQFSPCPYHDITCNCRSYYHRIMAFLPSTCGLLAVVGLIGLYILKRRRDRNNEGSLLVNPDDEIVTTNDYGTINN